MTVAARIGAIILLNALLAAVVQLTAASPKLTDRQEYEWVGHHPLEPGCPWTVYCYRVLVPVLLEQIPVDAEVRWRGYQWAANTAAGSLVAVTTAGLVTGWPAPFLATAMVQSSFGFAFTALDPYSADPMVFVFAAGLAWLWFANRPGAALATGLVGLFAKETVVLVSGAAGLAALLDRRRPGWRWWMVQAGIAATALLAFHWVMDTYFGWGITRNAAANFSEGSWLALWWRGNPGLVRKAFLLFAPFGFAWLFAIAGYRTAPRDLRQLALGAVLPFLALNYVQNPERALASTFFVVVPLATLALSRVPPAVALGAVMTNGALTARIGTGTEWLPAASFLFGPALVMAAWVFWYWRSSPTAISTA